MPLPGGIITDRLRPATLNAFISQSRRRPAKQQRRQEAHRRTQLNADTTSGAQCFPRHACPLKRLVLMQSHKPKRAVLVVALLSLKPFMKQMHFHAHKVIKFNLKNTRKEIS